MFLYAVFALKETPDNYCVFEGIFNTLEEARTFARTLLKHPHNHPAYVIEAGEVGSWQESSLIVESGNNAY